MFFLLYIAIKTMIKAINNDIKSMHWYFASKFDRAKHINLFAFNWKLVSMQTVSQLWVGGGAKDWAAASGMQLVPHGMAFGAMKAMGIYSLSSGLSAWSHIRLHVVPWRQVGCATGNACSIFAVSSIHADLRKWKREKFKANPAQMQAHTQLPIHKHKQL